MQKEMAITFDPAKSERNILARGLSFEMAGRMARSEAAVSIAKRQEPTATRFVAIGEIDGIVHVVVFTIEGFDPPHHLASPREGKGGQGMARRPNPYMTDDDNPELTPADIAAMKPAGEGLPAAAYADLVASEPKRARGQRGPGKRPAKVAVSLRFDRTVLEAWRATGDGWQARIHDVIAREAPKAKRRA